MPCGAWGRASAPAGFAAAMPSVLRWHAAHFAERMLACTHLPLPWLGANTLPPFFYCPGGLQLQFAQWANDLSFRLFDYGTAAANRRHYGRDRPPSLAGGWAAVVGGDGEGSRVHCGVCSRPGSKCRLANSLLEKEATQCRGQPSFPVGPRL